VATPRGHGATLPALREAAAAFGSLTSSFGTVDGHDREVQPTKCSVR
jgi:hypothetical protein